MLKFSHTKRPPSFHFSALNKLAAKYMCSKPPIIGEGNFSGENIYASFWILRQKKNRILTNAVLYKFLAGA